MLYNFMGMKTHGPVRCGSSSGAESFGGPGLGIAPRAARNRNLAGAQGPPAGARMQTTARPTRGPRLLAGLALSGLTRVGLPLLLVLGIVSVADATTVKKANATSQPLAVAKLQKNAGVMPRTATPGALFLILGLVLLTLAGYFGWRRGGRSTTLVLRP